MTSLPSLDVLAGALAVGALAYGVSILLDAYALRALGAAREAAVFATAPFAGALLAIPLLGESWTMADLGAAALMAFGVVLLVGDRHEHLHAHEALAHDHRHVHDEHHRPRAPARRRSDRAAQPPAPARADRARAPARERRPPPPRPRGVMRVLALRRRVVEPAAVMRSSAFIFQLS